MKKFSELNSTIDTKVSELPNEQIEIEEPVQTVTGFPPYMVDDPTFMGYPDTDMQIRIYQSSVFSILNATNNKPTTILDVGCGRGDFGNYLFNSGYNVKYTGVDLNPLVIDVGKYKYANLIETKSDFFSLENVNFSENTELSTKFDWVFHITDMTIDYGNFNDLSRYEYFEKILKKSLSVSNEGVVLMLLNSNSNLQDNLYMVYSLGEISEILYRSGYKFAIDNTDFSNIFKLIVLNNKF